MNIIRRISQKSLLSSGCIIAPFQSFSTHYCNHHDHNSSQFLANVPFLLPRRFQSGGTRTGRGPRGPVGVQFTIQELKDALENRDFRSFDMKTEQLTNFSLTPSQKSNLGTILKKWNRSFHYEDEYPRILKRMSKMKFTAHDDEDRQLIESLCEQYLKIEKKTARWFSLFLTAIRALSYKAPIISEDHLQFIRDSMTVVSQDRKMNEKDFTEIISGLAGLGIEWTQLPEIAQNNLFIHMDNLGEYLVADFWKSILFNLGKMGADLAGSDYKRKALQITMTTLKAIERDRNDEEQAQMVRIPFFLLNSFSFSNTQFLDFCRSSRIGYKWFQESGFSRGIYEDINKE
jgi:hypothetical protein